MNKIVGITQKLQKSQRWDKKKEAGEMLDSVTAPALVSGSRDLGNGSNTI